VQGKCRNISMHSDQPYKQKTSIFKEKILGKYPDLLRKFEIDINQIELEDSKTIQTTFT
jgi:hypothetical protein